MNEELPPAVCAGRCITLIATFLLSKQPFCFVIIVAEARLHPEAPELLYLSFTGLEIFQPMGAYAGQTVWSLGPFQFPLGRFLCFVLAEKNKSNTPIISLKCIVTFSILLHLQIQGRGDPSFHLQDLIYAISVAFSKCQKLTVG